MKNQDHLGEIDTSPVPKSVGRLEENGQFVANGLLKLFSSSQTP
jgi:hypothetical protein